MLASTMQFSTYEQHHTLQTHTHTTPHPKAEKRRSLRTRRGPPETPHPTSDVVSQDPTACLTPNQQPPTPRSHHHTPTHTPEGAPGTSTTAVLAKRPATGNEHRIR